MFEKVTYIYTPLMDTDLLIAKVTASALLSPAEKEHWVSVLPSMTTPQRQKFETIIEEAEGLAWNEEMKNYIAISAKKPLSLVTSFS